MVRYHIPLSLWQLFNSFSDFLEASSLLDTFEICDMGNGRRELVLKAGMPPKQQQQQQQQPPLPQQQQHAADENDMVMAMNNDALGFSPEGSGMAAEQHRSSIHTHEHPQSAAAAVCEGCLVTDHISSPPAAQQAAPAAAAVGTAADRLAVLDGKNQPQLQACAIALPAADADAAWPAVAGVPCNMQQHQASQDCAAAAAGDKQCSDESALLVEAVQVLQQCTRLRKDSWLPLPDFWDVLRGSSLADRFGGSMDTAVAFVQRWPNIFMLQPGPAASASATTAATTAAGGVRQSRGSSIKGGGGRGLGLGTNVAAIGLQRDVVRQLLKLPHCQQLLKEYVLVLIQAAVQVEADAAATAAGGAAGDLFNRAQGYLQQQQQQQRQPRGVELGCAGNPQGSGSGIMPPGLIPYRQVRSPCAST